MAAGGGKGLREGLPMSGRNGSASDAECHISEESRGLDDVGLAELGPLLEGSGCPGAAKGVMSWVKWRGVERGNRMVE